MMPTDVSPESGWILGIDIGGSRLKSRVVHPETGVFGSERFGVETPDPATPAALAEAVGTVIDHFQWEGPVACTFPGVVQPSGEIKTAVNLHPEWVDRNAIEALAADRPNRLSVVNDADAAGVAEYAFGAAKGVSGVVLVLTLGTGVGSGFLHDGVLIPNTELGHIHLDGDSAELQMAARIKNEEHLTFTEWGTRVDRFLDRVEFLFWPDLIVLGGGISKAFDDFASTLTCRAPVVPAELGNDAGVLGAAIMAHRRGNGGTDTAASVS